MLSLERRELIKKELLNQRSVTVADMAAKFNVTTETIRRDFDILSDQGFINKIYGGATLRNRTIMDTPQNVRTSLLVENKKRMAKKAASLIQSNDSIFLDHSTTVLQICDFIYNKPLTIATNSLLIADHFSSIEKENLINLEVTGGSFDPSEQGFFGITTINYLQMHRFDKAIITCKSVDINKGLHDSSEKVAEVRRNIISNSNMTVLLLDHTKFNKSSFLFTSGFENIHCIITDSKIDYEWKVFFEKAGIQVYECLYSDD